MIFITLTKLRKKLTKEYIAQSGKLWEQQAAKDGVKMLAQYWTLGRYDHVTITEAKDEKSLMKFVMRWGDTHATESLVALPREEAIKLIE